LSENLKAALAAVTPSQTEDGDLDIPGRRLHVRHAWRIIMQVD
jgi:hypothetical protein